MRLRPEALGRATFCFPDSVHEPTDAGDRTLLDRLCRLADASGLDDLDDYVEAQVHRPIRLDADVDAVVLDPCYLDADVEEAAGRLGCRVEFHPGFRARPEDLDSRYRGAEIVDLARSLGDELTPGVIGSAARAGGHPAEAIKQVWHCLARFGRVGRQHLG